MKAAVLTGLRQMEVRDVPGSGAAGGLGAGLVAFAGASLAPGVEIVMEANGGRRSVPTILFPDDSILVEPSNQELAEKFS